MEPNPNSADAPIVRCEVCLKEIPRSEAVNAEAQDYVLHFCGIECYRTWAQSAATQGAATTRNAPGQPCATEGGRT